MNPLQALRVLTFTTLITLVTAVGAWAQSVVSSPPKAPHLFSITCPKGWIMTPPESLDDYTTFEGPNGTYIYFRAVSGSIEKAVAAGQAELKSNYRDLKLKPQETSKLDGLASAVIKGTGISTEDSTRYSIELTWVELPGSNIAEIWLESSIDDPSGLLRAFEIIKTFEAQKETSTHSLR